MATMDPDTVDALNMLLEDVRASVEIEVALSNGATEYLEREALTAMGVEDTLLAFRLRDWLASHDLPVTRRINGIVLQALDLTRYDDRLTLFMHHQLASREQAEQLLEDIGERDEDDEGEERGESDLDRAGQEILRSLVDAHTRHASWSEARAREFAETRQFEFRVPGPRPSGPSGGSDTLDTPDAPDAPDAPESADPPETSGARSFPRGARTMATPATRPDIADEDEDDADGEDEEDVDDDNDDGDYDIDDADDADDGEYDMDDAAPVSDRPPAE